MNRQHLVRAPVLCPHLYGVEIHNVLVPVLTVLFNPPYGYLRLRRPVERIEAQVAIGGNLHIGQQHRAVVAVWKTPRGQFQCPPAARHIGYGVETRGVQRLLHPLPFAVAYVPPVLGHTVEALAVGHRIVARGCPCAHPQVLAGRLPGKVDEHVVIGTGAKSRECGGCRIIKGVYRAAAKRETGRTILHHHGVVCVVPGKFETRAPPVHYMLALYPPTAHRHRFHRQVAIPPVVESTQRHMPARRPRRHLHHHRVEPAVGVEGVYRHEGRQVVGILHRANHQPCPIVITPIGDLHLLARQPRQALTHHIGVGSGAPVAEVHPSPIRAVAHPRVLHGVASAAHHVVEDDRPVVGQLVAGIELRAVSIGRRGQARGAGHYLPGHAPLPSARGIHGDAVAGVGLESGEGIRRAHACEGERVAQLSVAAHSESAGWGAVGVPQHLHLVVFHVPGRQVSHPALLHTQAVDIGTAGDAVLVCLHHAQRQPPSRRRWGPGIGQCGPVGGVGNGEGGQRGEAVLVVFAPSLVALAQFNHRARVAGPHAEGHRHRLARADGRRGDDAEVLTHIVLPAAEHERAAPLGMVRGDHLGQIVFVVEVRHLHPAARPSALDHILKALGEGHGGGSALGAGQRPVTATTAVEARRRCHCDFVALRGAEACEGIGGRGYVVDAGAIVEKCEGAGCVVGRPGEVDRGGRCGRRRQCAHRIAAQRCHSAQRPVELEAPVVRDTVRREIHRHRPRGAAHREGAVV